MRLIKPSVELLKQDYTLDGIYKQIELAGRTCYRSENKITEDSAKAFVDRMIKSLHLSVLEHGTVYLDLPNSARDFCAVEDYAMNKYSRLMVIEENGMFHNYVTTNLRVLVEHNWLDDLQYICEPTEYHEKRITVKWTCDRGILAEFTRHRVFSFTAESTRYCNYSKNRFGNEVTFIIPCWLEWDEQNIHYGDFEKSGSGSTDSGLFINSLLDAEYYYLCLLQKGWKPQQARSVLPNALKTELVMTGFVSDWKHFFDLRCDKAAHPDAQYLANKCLELFKEHKYL